MVITNYSFFSIILDQKLFSPSRVYAGDGTTNPLKGNKYSTKYKELMIYLINKNKHVKKFTKTLQQAACTTANSKLKKLVKTIKEFYDVQFNPSSHQQLSLLLFGYLKLPVIDKTKSGAPATGGSTLKDLANHTTDQDILDL